jgi:hypothetical protein
MSNHRYHKLQECHSAPETQFVNSRLDCIREESKQPQPETAYGQVLRGRIWIVHCALILFNLATAAVLLALTASARPCTQLGSYEYCKRFLASFPL